MRSTRRLTIGLVCLALAASSVAGASPGTGRLVDDGRIAAQAADVLASVATRAGPGVAVLIAQGDRVIYRAARGDADIELGVPLGAGQVFRIASVTKMFTAALVLKLAEQGKLSLDDPLARYLPDFPNAAGITLRQLLDHTAGVSDKALPGNSQPGFNRRDVDTATLVAEIARRPTAFAPGTAQSYSNAGFILLGAVIEKVTGQPWHVAMHDQLLAPLGLDRTGYGIASAVLPGRVAGYTSDTPDHRIRNANFISMTIPAAAGALVSTVDDLRLWMRALTGGRVIGEASYRQMITPVTPGGVMPGHPYGMGMYVWRVRGETMIGHTGQIDGFASILAYVPSRDITIVALGNDDNFDAQNFGRRLAAIALGKPYPVPTGVAMTPAVLAGLVGAYQEGPIVRTLTAKDGKLFAQRGGGNVVPLQMTANGELHFVPDELSYLVPVRDAAGAVIRLDYFDHGDGPPVAAPRIAPAPPR